MTIKYATVDECGMEAGNHEVELDPVAVNKWHSLKWQDKLKVLDFYHAKHVLGDQVEALHKVEFYNIHPGRYVMRGVWGDRDRTAWVIWHEDQNEEGMRNHAENIISIWRED